MPAPTLALRRSINLLFQQSEELSFGDALLSHRVAFAEGESVAFLLDRVEVNGDAPRCADFVLTAVAAPDGARFVVEAWILALELLVELLGAGDELLLVFEERQHGDFDRGDAWAEAENGACLGVAFFVGNLLLGVARGEDGEEDAVEADGGLDDVRDEFLLGGFVEDFLRLAGGVGVLREVVVAARSDAPELLHAEGELEHDVRGALRVERELFLEVVVFGEVGGGEADGEEPVLAPVDPVAVPLGPVVVLVDEEFHLHLLELAGAEDEVARGDLVAEGFAGLCDAEGQLHAAGVHDILEIDEHALGGLGAEVGDGRGVGHGADVRLEHHVEGAGRGEVAGVAGGGRGDQRDLLGLGLCEVAERDANNCALDSFLALHCISSGKQVSGGVFGFKSRDVANGYPMGFRYHLPMEVTLV